MQLFHQLVRFSYLSLGSIIDDNGSFDDVLYFNKIVMRVSGMSLRLIFSILLLPSIVVANERPNILIIVADDLGYSDLGCYGGEISTPHLDALAYNGIRMTQMYNMGRCCPSRASILTGQYPHRVGLGHHYFW